MKKQIAVTGVLAAIMLTSGLAMTGVTGSTAGSTIDATGTWELREQGLGGRLSLKLGVSPPSGDRNGVSGRIVLSGFPGIDAANVRGSMTGDDGNLGQMGFSVCTDPSTAPDQVACFSNSADFLTMWAPGCRILAAGISMCGTSQATPHVAGAAAVLRAPNAFPTHALDCTTSRLRKVGVPVTDPRNGLTFDRLDLFGAAESPPNWVGDCDSSGDVRVCEIVRALRIALGQAPLSNCPQIDFTGDGRATIDELVTAVAISLTGCSVGESENP